MKELDYPFDSSYVIKNSKRLKKQMQEDKGERISIKIAVLGGSTTHDICTYLQLFLLNQGIVLDGELRETQTANYFSNFSPVDCAVPSANA